MATNRSPGCTSRLSKVTPVTSKDALARPPVAASISAEVLQRLGNVLDEHVRMIDGLRQQEPSSAGSNRLWNEVMAVVDRPGHCDEQVAGPYLAAVESHARDFEVAVRRAARRRRNFASGPQRAHAAHSRATSASSNGSTLSPTI
jgi:hypothetical protein